MRTHVGPVRSGEATLRHGARFLALGFLLWVAANSVYPAFQSWLSPPPPLDLQVVSDEDAIAVHEAGLGRTAERERFLRERGLYEPFIRFDLPPDAVRGDVVQTTPPEVDQLWHRIGDHGRTLVHVRERGRFIAWVFLGILVAATNRRIGYPPERALLMLLPLVAYVWLVKVLWRHASPTRYWTDETAIGSRASRHG